MAAFYHQDLISGMFLLSDVFLKNNWWRGTEHDILSAVWLCLWTALLCFPTVSFQYIFSCRYFSVQISVIVTDFNINF